MAIAQTRWATHGHPSKINAHPHFDNERSLAVVHNGIIENFESLRSTLSEKGALFVSQTDTEVIAHLVASFYEGDILKAVQQSIPLLKGSFAFALIHQDFPDQIIAVAQEMPLIVGLGIDEVFLSSDSYAFITFTKNVFFLENSEIAVIQSDSIKFFDCSENELFKKSERLTIEGFEASKGQYKHYTLKEIFEQPHSITAAFASRFQEEYGTAIFEELKISLRHLMACGLFSFLFI